MPKVGDTIPVKAIKPTPEQLAKLLERNTRAPRKR